VFKKLNLLVLLGVLAAAFAFAAPASASTGENDLACESYHHCQNATPDPLDGIEGGCWGIGTFCYFTDQEPAADILSGGCWGIGTFCYFGQPEQKIMVTPTLAEPILNGRVVIN
jgi:hypothetical protein